jgi:TonB family protein
MQLIFANILKEIKMKTITINSFLFILFFGINLFAQDDKPDVTPGPIGGMKAIQEKIVYPEIAMIAGIDEKVYVLASIDETGFVTNAKIIKGIGAGCNEAALDAVKHTKFTPAMKDQEPLKVEVVIPIVFVLS